MILGEVKKTQDLTASQKGVNMIVCVLSANIMLMASFHVLRKPCLTVN